MFFSELRQKEVINCRDCMRLGYVADMEFDARTGSICSIVVPGSGRWFGCFGIRTSYCIPFCNIVRIGEDIVLVDICLDDCLMGG